MPQDRLGVEVPGAAVALLGDREVQVRAGLDDPGPADRADRIAGADALSDFEVVAAAPGEMTVRVAGCEYRVCCADVESPAGARPRRYVVAWTEETKETAG